MIKKIRFALLMVCLAAVLSGCGLIDYYFLPPPEDTAFELYEAGVDAMKEKHYEAAAEYFAKLKDRFPFSPYAVKGEVGLADAYFLDDKYIEAAEAYKEFEAMHPGNEEIPYILYQVGMSNLNQFKSIDRRQDNIKEGLEYFYRVEQAYPDTEYGKNARKLIKRCRRILAEHELFVADFFFSRSQFGPAWHRYRYVVENYSDIADLRVYAHKRAQQAYFEYQKELSEEERMEIQDSWMLWLREWL